MAERPTALLTFLLRTLNEVSIFGVHSYHPTGGEPQSETVADLDRNSRPDKAGIRKHIRPWRHLRQWHGDIRRPSAPEEPLPASVYTHARPSMINIQGRDWLSHEADDRRSVFGRSTLALIEHEQGRAAVSLATTGKESPVWPTGARNCYRVTK